MTTTLLLIVILALVAIVCRALSGGAAGQPRGVQQEHLALAAIADSIVTITDGRRRAVLEVGSVNFAAHSPAQQRELVAGYGAALASLTYPVQVLVRAAPLDLAPYLDEREARALQEPHEQLRRLNRNRIAFVRRLASKQTFLDRRFYLIVPADDSHPVTRWRVPRPGRQRTPERRSADGDTVASQQLAARCADLASQLGRCGLTAQRLDDAELAELAYACWCPDLAQIQRLRHDLRDEHFIVTRAPTDIPAERMVP